MTDGITVEIDLSQFDPEIDRLKANLPNIMQRIVQALAQYTEGQMNLRAPVDTSFLRDSIEPRYPSMTEAFVAPTADYGIWVELTWQKRNYGGFKIASTKGFVADTSEDAVKQAETIANDILAQELR